MANITFRQVTIFVVVLFFVALGYWLTLHEEPDPCAEGQQDISGAVLAEGEDNQDALVNRAIIRKGRCPQPGTPTE